MKSTIQPSWPAPASIFACTTLRTGGVSRNTYDTFNLGEHVGDDNFNVQKNRELLAHMLDLPSEPIWLKQTHSTIVLPATYENKGKEADASFTSLPNQVCVILTADCLPILLCNRQGTEVAAIHAGWRGLAKGIIENTLQAMKTPPHEILAWLGPAISPKVYEVGEEVRDQFLSAYPHAEQAFTPSPQQRWLADLYALARLSLQEQQVTQIYGGEHCTYLEKNLFFSARRDGIQTGRMASLIWISTL